jgi:hypothetical protein
MKPLAAQPITQLSKRRQHLCHHGAAAAPMLAMAQETPTLIAPEPMEGIISGYINHLSRTTKGERLKGTILKSIAYPGLDQMG